MHIAAVIWRVMNVFIPQAAELGGDMKGDGYQNGGTFVMDKGGKVLLKYIQENPADHVEPSDVLKALNISAEATN